MEELRASHDAAMASERARAAAVEESARSLSALHEERVATLEGRLSTLSLTVASYDRTRQDDISAIQKLKVFILLIL